jgi:hypothetical protein
MRLGNAVRWLVLSAAICVPAVTFADPAGKRAPGRLLRSVGDRARAPTEAAGLESSATDSTASGTAVNTNGSDACVAAEAITGSGPFGFDTTNATTDGPTHQACDVHGDNHAQIEKDVWFCWTAPADACPGGYLVETCGRTAVDTKVAVYNGCNCPPTDATLLACRDDDCGLQTRTAFPASPGHGYLIRLGSFPGQPGGGGTFTVRCAVPEPCAEPAAHCQPQNRTDALISNRTDLVVADDFATATAGSITELCWWGAYEGADGFDCQGVSPDSFEVQYFLDLNGVPGALLAAFSQSGGTLAVDGPVRTNFLIAGSAPEYAYSAVHAGVAVITGVRYWVEISNAIPGCTWLWEVGRPSDEWAVQDGAAGPTPQPPDGYDPRDVIGDDLAFCLNLPLPPLPSNDRCSASLPLTGVGQFGFDNSFATTDGAAHAACLSSNQTQIEHDVWYCWTSPCTATVFVRTCGMTEVDTRLAVYRGCSCPATSDNLLVCNDDLCGLPNGFQSMAMFPATAGQSYLIRLGTFPGTLGGTGAFEITCGPPNHPSCPGSGSCCAARTGSGCGNETCCETICACDPFCCNTEWDDNCATIGFFRTGCGAAVMCGCSDVCGDANAGDCCTGHLTPGCSNATCCEAVCACDPYCCNTAWDSACSTTGLNPGCGADVLCPSLCNAQCPAGPIAWLNPPDGVVDARAPHGPDDAAALRGIQRIKVGAPAGADALGCWHLCESADGGSPNSVASVTSNGDGTVTIELARPMTGGAVTRISYVDANGGVHTGQFISHPGNVNADGTADSTDVETLRRALAGTTLLLWGLFAEDVDHSTLFSPADILEAIDLLNGAGAYASWNGTPLPTATGTCPP